MLNSGAPSSTSCRYLRRNKGRYLTAILISVDRKTELKSSYHQSTEKKIIWGRQRGMMAVISYQLWTFPKITTISTSRTPCIYPVNDKRECPHNLNRLKCKHLYLDTDSNSQIKSWSAELSCLMKPIL